MKRRKSTPIILLFLLTVTAAHAQLEVTFPSKDKLNITADWYPISSKLPVILLCHQNNSSRGEYLETALRLNKFGFNCLAIDQRVGGEVNGVQNKTAAEAAFRKLSPTMADAEQDMIAAVDYLYQKYQRPVIILGSSYSASLALKIAAENPRVSEVLAFSPGEYFNDTNYISRSIVNLTKPIFVSSSKDEAEKVTDFIKDVNSRLKIQYVPSSPGDHGSKVLWSQSPSNQEYWIALMSFLTKIKGDSD